MEMSLKIRNLLRFILNRFKTDIRRIKMTEEQLRLLKKALDLYHFVIDQRRCDNYDNDESNAFYYMKQALSELIGTDIDEVI